MKHTRYLRLIPPLFFSSLSLAQAQPEQVIEEKVQALLAQMTLEEKVGQMTQIDVSMVTVNHTQTLDGEKLKDAIVDHHVGSILNAPSTPTNQAQFIETWRDMTHAIGDMAKQTRLHIPVIYGIDAIHGATYTQKATLFPQAINMAATFNAELSFQEGEVTAREIKASGIDWNFSPVMDVGRQPLWPRLWETYGEDVYVASRLGSAFIAGHQGHDMAAADKAPTCLKHYVGYSAPSSGKDRTPALIGERSLRDVFLPSFQAGIAAGAPAIMVNSAEVDGIPGHANYHYLTTILRDELGFRGFTVSDWEDIIRLYTRDKVAASPREAVKMAVMAGVDMSMVPLSFSFYDLLLELVHNGDVPEARINEAVSRILRVKYQSGLFERALSPISVQDHFATKEATWLNRQAAQESIILAKNDQHFLPLDKHKKTSILVTGPTANLLSVMNGGWTITWQGDNESLYPHDKLTLFKAIQQKNHGKVTYVGEKNPQDDINIKQAVHAARQHDVIILALGEKPYTETAGNIDSLNLPLNQQQLANALLKTGKPVVLVLFGGRPRIITDIAQRANAVVLGFLPGMEGGVAMADILFGDVNPSAKLPISYPRDANDLMTYDHKPMESYAPNTYHPLYSFGHGLSYSEFKTSHLTLNKTQINAGESIDVSVEVSNTGKRMGKETVLVYLNDVVASVTRPTKQLKAFAKVTLQPNETQTVHFTLSAEAMSLIGVDMKRRVEAGEFRVMVGDETVSFYVNE